MVYHSKATDVSARLAKIVGLPKRGEEQNREEGEMAQKKVGRREK